MGKFKLVLDVVEDMRALANSLEAVANVICENEVEDDMYEEGSVVAGESGVCEDSEVVKKEEIYKKDSEVVKKEEIYKTDSEVVKKEEIYKTDSEVAKEEEGYKKDSKVVKEEGTYKKDSEEEIKEVREISLEEVRAVLAKKSQAGFTDEIRSIIRSYGCEKLSEVDSKYYKDIMIKCEVFSSEG